MKTYDIATMPSDALRAAIRVDINGSVVTAWELGDSPPLISPGPDPVFKPEKRINALDYSIVCDGDTDTPTNNGPRLIALSRDVNASGAVAIMPSGVIGTLDAFDLFNKLGHEDHSSAIRFLPAARSTRLNGFMATNRHFNTVYTSLADTLFLKRMTYIDDRTTNGSSLGFGNIAKAVLENVTTTTNRYYRGSGYTPGTYTGLAIPGGDGLARCTVVIGSDGKPVSSLITTAGSGYSSISNVVIPDLDTVAGGSSAVFMLRSAPVGALVVGAILNIAPQTRYCDATIDLYACVKNMKIKDSDFSNLTECSAGAPIWVRNLTAAGAATDSVLGTGLGNVTENITIENTVINNTTQDEVFAVFATGGLVRNVTADRCKFKGLQSAVQRASNVSVFPLSGTSAENAGYGFPANQVAVSTPVTGGGGTGGKILLNTTFAGAARASAIDPANRGTGYPNTGTFTITTGTVPAKFYFTAVGGALQTATIRGPLQVSLVTFRDSLYNDRSFWSEGGLRVGSSSDSPNAAPGSNYIVEQVCDYNGVVQGSMPLPDVIAGGSSWMRNVADSKSGSFTNNACYGTRILPATSGGFTVTTGFQGWEKISGVTTNGTYTGVSGVGLVTGGSHIEANGAAFYNCVKVDDSTTWNVTGTTAVFLIDSNAPQNYEGHGSGSSTGPILNITSGANANSVGQYVFTRIVSSTRSDVATTAFTNNSTNIRVLVDGNVIRADAPGNVIQFNDAAKFRVGTNIWSFA